MKRILLICVNYNSYNMLYELLESINRAAEKTTKQFNIDVIIADNTPYEKSETIQYKLQYIQVVHKHFYDNPGYLGAAQCVYNQIAKNYDFTIISNADLTLNKDFFVELNNLKISDDIGWLAPDIFTSADNKHENPYMLNRPQKHNFLIWNIIYSNTLIYRVYNSLSLIRKKHRIKPDVNTMMYAAHGSFMLFTKTFINSHPTLNFNSYLYGEEIYFAELMLLAGLKVLYCPCLKIDNVGHVNMKTLTIKQKAQWSKQSLKIIKNLFFS